MARVVLLGAGMMGSAMCMPLCDSGHDVHVVGTILDDFIIDELEQGRPHPGLGVTLPEGVSVYRSGELGEVMRGGVDAVVLGVSSKGVGWAGEALGPYLQAETPVLMVTKGLSPDGEGLELMPDALVRALPRELEGKVWPCAVAGPCIAGELARRVPSCVVFTGRRSEVAQTLHAMFSAPYYNIWVSRDVVGVEVCAALKNAYALAIAFGVGMDERRGGEGGSVAMHNVESAVFAQSAVEMSKIVEVLGGDRSTVLGLAGVGDLDVTCNGGRTGRFGRWLGLGLSVEDAVHKMDGATLECIEIIGRMSEVLPMWEEQGQVGATDLALMRHLIEVVLEDKPLALPFQGFFAG